MDFLLDPEQAQLRDSLQVFLRDQYPLAARTAACEAAGWRPDVWRRLGSRELGVLGAAFDEAHGGSGGGPVEHLVVQQAFGAALVLEPYLESVVIAGGLLRRAGGTAAAQALRRVLDGDDSVAVGWLESGARFDLAQVATTAQPVPDGWRLDGRKVAVVGAGWGSQLLVTARTDGAAREAHGISLFLVPRDAPGVTLHAFHTLDGRRAADVVLDGVTLPPQALLGAPGAALPWLEQVADEAVAAQCAEAVGLMERMLRDTVDYTRQRRQFGQPIASFQALQHRMADMLMHLELARSATYGALLSSAADADERARVASTAKVTVDEALRFVGQNAVQLHGGMGMSDATPVTHCFRRATVLGCSLGSRDHHLARFARLEPAAAPRDA
jgi:alkylation response protein AidB-like acyl-CoA dehydrogenase